MDWNDLLFKTLWTAVSAALGLVAIELADAPYAWAPVAVTVANAVTVWVRQRFATAEIAGGAR
jgi:hypothetical protein